MAAGLRTLTLSGKPYERGLQHGEALRELISEHYGRWREFVKNDTGLSHRVYLKKFFSETDFLPSIERYTPDLMEEVRGLAVGANQPFAQVLARQLSDEETWFRQILKFGRGLPEHCSSLAAAGINGQPNIVAQNMDSPGYYHGFETVLRIRDPESDIEALVFTVAGKISLAGMNNQGLAIACNTVLFLEYNPAGLPEDFIVRKTLQKSSLDEALVFMRAIPHASGQNYVLGDPTDVVDLEASSAGVESFEPLMNPKRIYHTNHPFVNKDTKSWDGMMERGKKIAPELVADMMSRFTTYERCDSLKNRVEKSEYIDVPTAKSILSEHEGGVCIHFTDYDKNYTSGCLVMELSREHPKFHVAPGPGCRTPFTTLDFMYGKAEENHNE